MVGYLVSWRLPIVKSLTLPPFGIGFLKFSLVVAPTVSPFFTALSPPTSPQVLTSLQALVRFEIALLNVSTAGEEAASSTGVAIVNSGGEFYLFIF